MLYPSTINHFSERQLSTQTKPLSHLLSSCRDHVVLGTEEKISYKILHYKNSL